MGWRERVEGGWKKGGRKVEDMRGAMSGGLVRVDDEREGRCRVCDKDDDQEWRVCEGCVREGGEKSEGCAREGGGRVRGM